MINQDFVSTVHAPASLRTPAYWFLFCGSRLLVHVDEEGAAQIPFAVSPADMGITAVPQGPLVRRQYLGFFDRERLIHVYSGELLEDYEAPEGMALEGLRRLYGRLPEALFWMAGRAIQIVNWDRTHQFCSRCGAPTRTEDHERAKRCPECHFTTYPRLAPAIIVLVEKHADDANYMLLARNNRFPPGLYSVLAGFVEPGETLEACVRREVHEEVGIDVKNIRYFGSQPWPFPHSLMIAFTAEYAGGELALEEEEITEAGWFTVDDMPQVPPPLSISRQLIDWFVAKNS